MAETFAYEELDLQSIRASFDIHGEVFIKLPKHHAVACIELIEVIENVQTAQFKGFSLFRRIFFLVGALSRTLRILPWHGRLFFLCPLFILSPVSKQRERLSDGTFLFRFVKR